VGVDLGDAVGEVVTEASCLGDLGCAAGDEPGLVAVPQSMEGQPRSNRDSPGTSLWLGFVAVDRWLEHAADKGTAPPPLSALGGEDELVVVPLEMLAEQPDQERRQGNDPSGGRGLGCAEPTAVATFVQGAMRRTSVGVAQTFSGGMRRLRRPRRRRRWTGLAGMRPSSAASVSIIDRSLMMLATVVLG
jgi:hypothetical protein